MLLRERSVRRVVIIIKRRPSRKERSDGPLIIRLATLLGSSRLSQSRPIVSLKDRRDEEKDTHDWPRLRREEPIDAMLLLSY